MLLDLIIVNEDATLNNFKDIGSQRFFPGDAFKMVIQLRQIDRDLRYITAITATFEITLLKSDNTDFTKSGTLKFTDDRSVIEFSFTDSDATNLIGQNLTVKITEGSDVSFALLRNGLQSAGFEC